ncbi:hypothetical protein QJQ45_026745, partial [Haematococcus lacustris]
MLGGSVVESRESGTAGMDSLLEQAKALAALSLATEGKTLASVAPYEQAQLVAKAIQVLQHQRSQAQQAQAQQAQAQQALAQQALAQQALAQQALAQQAQAQQALAQQAPAQQALARKLSMRESLQAQLAQLDSEMQVGSPQTPRTPLAGGSQQTTTSQFLALGKENREAALGKIALGLNDNKPAGSVSAVGAALKAVSGSEEGKTPTSSLLQAKRSYKRKAASQPSMGDFLTMYAERNAEEAQRTEAMRS